MTDEEKKAIEQAISSVTRGVDIESAMLILEKCVLDGLIITRGRINIFKIAVRQIVEFLKEYKDKGYLDVVREKVKANETVEKQSKEIEHQKEKRENQKKELAILNAKQIEFNKLVNTVNSYKGQFKRQQKEIEELKVNNKKLQDKCKELIFEKQELTSALLDSTPNDKIKAKIEPKLKELDEQINEEWKKYGNSKELQDMEDMYNFLQSLLEKE